MTFEDTLAARRCADVAQKPAETENEFYRSTGRRVYPTRTFRCPTCRAEHLREIPAHVCPPTPWRVKVVYAIAGAGLMFMAIVMATWAMWGVVVAG